MNADLRYPRSSAAKNFRCGSRRWWISSELSKDQIYAFLTEAAVGCEFAAHDRQEIRKLRMFADEVAARNTLLVFVESYRKRPHAGVSLKNAVAREIGSRHSQVSLGKQIVDFP